MAQPAVTFCLITRNHEASVADALDAAQAQDFEPLEILVSDDASRDGTVNIVESAFRRYRGPHSVKLRRNDQAQDLCGNLNAAMAEADGELIVLAYGTDVSEPHRVSRLVEAWRDSGASVLASNALLIDGGNEAPTLAIQPTRRHDLTLAEFVRAGGNECCFGPTLAWHRRVFDEFGPIDLDRAMQAPDLIIPLLGLLLDGNHFIDEPLVRHRPLPRFDPETMRDQAFHGITREAVAEEEVKQLSCLILTLIDNADRLGGREPTPGLYVAQAVHPLLRKTSRWVGLRNRLYLSGYQNLWVEPPTEPGH